jgi:hypothetical protein
VRSLLLATLALFLPARGKRRANHTPPPAVPRPTVRPVRRTPKHSAPLDGHEVALVRPYLIAWEREQEQRRQRERRRAAVLATMGQDYAAGVSA